MYRLRNPDTWQWGLPEQILAGIFDGIQGGNWQRGGNKNAPRPKPMPRPGVGGTSSRKNRSRNPDEVSVPVTDIEAEFERRRAQYAAAATMADEPQIADPATAPEVKSRRLSVTEVRSARTMAGHGIDLEVIAAHLAVPLATIERLIAGETYRHIT